MFRIALSPFPSGSLPDDLTVDCLLVDWDNELAAAGCKTLVSEAQSYGPILQEDTVDALGNVVKAKKELSKKDAKKKEKAKKRAAAKASFELF